MRRCAAADMRYTGPFRWRDRLHLCLPADKAICVSLLLATVPYKICQDGLQNPRHYNHPLVYCCYYTGLCQLHTSESILVSGASSPPNNQMP